ncbi:hypothetical protein [Streptomyces caatingaensis]|uniref:AG2 protein n=1 Tax=Streptomyces caatingaensis TaxID=1678637 RepID=A0A0K9XE05_9ACTN|nr:hypothetical protein [Streptomyces caatingaensis]KNB51468.1 hypothetical protein AC230_13830 [Streptomyces caatingaensis]
MTLTYQDVVTIKLDSLTTAAAKWEEMAGKFQSVETLYKNKVQTVSDDGGWLGVAADGASVRFKGTQGQLAAAQKQAKAVASLLRDAHTQFTTLVKAVKDLVADAAKEHFLVDSQGKVTYDWNSVDEGAKKDPDYENWRRKTVAAETKWTDAIKKAVQHVDDADQGVKLALRAAADIRPMDDWLRGGHDFNANAKGDIEKYEAERATELRTKLGSDDELSTSELAELRRLFRDNQGDEAFTQTFLDGVGGPKGSIEFNQQLRELIGDDKNKAAYEDVRNGLAAIISTATRNPKTSFYSSWRESLRQAGDDNYGSKTNPLRGYQLFVDLMKHGGNYGTQFLHDTADDIIAAEKKNPGFLTKWGGGHSGIDNDALDSLLGIMSKQPDASTAFFDPGSDGKNERLAYLLTDRDWPKTTYVGPAGVHDDKVLAGFTGREGLGAALEAAATGHQPLRPDQHPNPTAAHNEAQARVMHGIVGSLDAGSIHTNLQRPVANALAEYSSDTHQILGGISGDYIKHAGGDGAWTEDGKTRMSVPADKLMQVMRGLSDSPEAYATLHKAESQYISEELGRLPKGAEGYERSNPLDKSGAVLGAYSAIREDVINDDKASAYTDADWKAKVAYHIIGGGVNYLPGGDWLQRGVDTWTFAWANENKAAADTEAAAKITDEYLKANNQMARMVDGWAEGRGIKDKNLVEGLTGDIVNGYDRGNNWGRHLLGNS